VFEFELTATDGPARAGLLHTPHGIIPTPVFMAVGTQATVKAMSPRDLNALGADIILANTYHLHLRPGDERIARLGGLHEFMGWNGPLLTDSGGYQIFSLAKMRKLDNEGVTFRSHIDGSTHHFTPEKAIEIQENLGADIIMCLDECPPALDYDYNANSLELTHAWAARCKAAKKRRDQALFGIVQGGVFHDLRERSARYLIDLGFDGYAIGGLSVGESKTETHTVIDWMAEALPVEQPRYLMGVGTPEDLVECMGRGIDMMDCVLPTRVARNGAALTRSGRRNMRNAQYADDPAHLEADCTCYTCTHFSRAYLHHLVKANEILGYYLLTFHNLHLMFTVAREIREAVMGGEFQMYRQAFWRRRNGS